MTLFFTGPDHGRCVCSALLRVLGSAARVLGPASDWFIGPNTRGLPCQRLGTQGCLISVELIYKLNANIKHNRRKI